LLNQHTGEARLSAERVRSIMTIGSDEDNCAVCRAARRIVRRNSMRKPFESGAMIAWWWVRISREGPWRSLMAVRKAAQQKQSPATAKQTVTSATRLSRGPVDAPRKRHRKPPPQEPLDKRMGEPRGKQMGQKSVKTGWRGGRG